MLSENLTWEFPSSAEEAAGLLLRPGALLHAGGTRILKTCPKSVKLLIDTGGLGLDYINFTDNAYYIGSGVTFSEIVKYPAKGKSLPLLQSSLSGAASTPLRNRITIGGSLKDFPLWSSLYAPLIALKARVEILTDKPAIHTVEDYVSSGIIKTKHLIKHLIIDEESGLISGVKKFSILKFQYPAFTIAIALCMKGRMVEDARLVITGVRNRFMRFTKAEEMLKGKTLNELTLEEVHRHISPSFMSDYKFSASYKEKAARIIFMDLFKEIKGGMR
ncbi:MAG: hypothetical protein HF314_04475 [Ignavibacteria bacterium]|jgi:CO/xanthine dehydrogenase FAD-binding subunit|nr:hypothetical protein [Ignavibacteria bacterium]MCU7502306.1 hypothetical protein [Ignavibacteria bacterium]MCU7516650.1 hypothetical protein [Ignavibacteria bacterium]